MPSVGDVVYPNLLAQDIQSPAFRPPKIYRSNTMDTSESIVGCQGYNIAVTWILFKKNKINSTTFLFNFIKKNTLERYNILKSHRIHVCMVYMVYLQHLPLKLTLYVGKYISPMDPWSYGNGFFASSQATCWTHRLPGGALEVLDANFL